MLIPTNKNIRTITHMREDSLKLLDEVKKEGLVYLFHHSDPKAVILSLEEFQRLWELVEDHLDEMEAYRLSDEPKGEGIPLTKILRKYKIAKSV